MKETEGLGEGFAESIGVEVAMDREGVLIITDSLSWLVTKTRLFSLLDRSLRNTELHLVFFIRKCKFGLSLRVS